VKDKEDGVKDKDFEDFELTNGVKLIDAGLG